MVQLQLQAHICLHDPLLMLNVCLQICFACQAPCVSWCIDMLHDTKVVLCCSQQYLFGRAVLPTFVKPMLSWNSVVQVLTTCSVLQQDKSITHTPGIVKFCVLSVTVPHVLHYGMQVVQLQQYLVSLLHQASLCHCWHLSPTFFHHPCCSGSCWTFCTRTVL